MSFSIQNLSVPVQSGIWNSLLNNVENTSDTLETLTEETSSGYISQNFAGLGNVGTSESLTLSSQVSAMSTDQTNISAVETKLNLSQQALKGINKIATQFYADMAKMNNIAPQQITTVAQSAKNALSEIAGILDTQNGSSYIFAGQDQSNPPVPNPNDITQSGFFTQIEAVVQNLSTLGATAVTTETITIASSNVQGTTVFSKALSQSPANVLALKSTLTMSSGEQLTYGIMAGTNSTGVVSGGSYTTGSYIRDILRSLAVIGSVKASQSTDPQFSALISQTAVSLHGSIAALNEEAGVMGDTQAFLTQKSTDFGNLNTILKTQLSKVQDANMSAVAIALSSTQNQLEASYRLISTISDLSLANYL